MLQEIAVSLLLPHPLNSNRMDQKSLAKLRRHVERTGTYEPLTVRPHPTEQGAFQVINGHHRLRVLRSLGSPTAQCVVWNVDDRQAKLYLATLNRLSGEDGGDRLAAMLRGNVRDNVTLAHWQHLPTHIEHACVGLCMPSAKEPPECSRRAEDASVRALMGPLHLSGCQRPTSLSKQGAGNFSLNSL